MDLMAKYLPIGFDVLFIKDIKKWGVLDGILAIACSTSKRYQLKSEPCYDCQKLLQKIVASIMACSRSNTFAWMVRFLR
jgi:hypothetical protein